MTQSYAKQNRYYWKRKSEGWRTCTYLLPPDVREQVRKYKNAAMAEYRKKNKNENFTTTDAEKV
jgi:hypothetical protein